MEVMVSMAIMAIALFAVFRLQAQNLDLQSEAYFMTLANQMGEQKMAEIQARPRLREGQSSGDLSEDYPAFRYEEEITRVQDRKHLFKVRLLVWDEGDLLQRRFLLETLLYRYTP